MRLCRWQRQRNAATTLVSSWTHLLLTADGSSLATPTAIPPAFLAFIIPGVICRVNARKMKRRDS
jgi:hypothetical protein